MSFAYVWTDYTTNKLYVGVHKGDPTEAFRLKCKEGWNKRRANKENPN